MEPEDSACEGGGKEGRRFGGLAVETCGLKVTLRGGFWLVGDGRRADGEDSRGVLSEAVAVEAMLALWVTSVFSETTSNQMVLNEPFNCYTRSIRV